MPLDARRARKDPSRVLCGGAGNTCRRELGWIGPEVNPEGQIRYPRDALHLDFRKLEGELVLPRRHGRRRELTAHDGRGLETRHQMHRDPAWPLRIACPRCGAINVLDPERLAISSELVVVSYAHRTRPVDVGRWDDGQTVGEVMDTQEFAEQLAEIGRFWWQQRTRGSDGDDLS